MHLSALTRYLIAPLLLVSFCQQAATAQSTPQPGWHTELEVGGWAASGQVMPFWLRTNQWGTVPLTTPSGTLRAGLWKGYAIADSTTRPRRFDWSAGIQAVGNAAAKSQVMLPEAYVKVRWKALELAAGRWRQLTGLGDSTLSSGFINGSGNALPIPKIQLATPGYVSLGFTKHFVAINAGYVHGWFNVPYIQHSFLHQKYAYIRLGKPNSKLKLHGGLNHQVQWAGQADYLKGTPLAVDGKLPSAFRYYPNVVFSTRPDNWEDADYTSFDGAYWFGNGLGSIDLGAELRTASGTWFLYHQHIYDDVSGFLWLNFPDGLTGVSWRRNPGAAAGWLNRIVAELLTTTNQSGPTFDYSARFQGADNYFNHGQYQEGWSYLGRTIGTPFIMPNTDVQASARSGLFFPNNRIQMLYVGAMGQLGALADWTLRLSASRNFGTFQGPYSAPYEQLSAFANVRWRLPRLVNTQLTTSLALDQGQLLPNTVGGYIGLRKTW